MCRCCCCRCSQTSSAETSPIHSRTHRSQRRHSAYFLGRLSTCVVSCPGHQCSGQCACRDIVLPSSFHVDCRIRCGPFQCQWFGLLVVRGRPYTRFHGHHMTAHSCRRCHWLSTIWAMSIPLGFRRRHLHNMEATEATGQLQLLICTQCQIPNSLSRFVNLRTTTPPTAW